MGLPPRLSFHRLCATMNKGIVATSFFSKRVYIFTFSFGYCNYTAIALARVERKIKKGEKGRERERKGQKRGNRVGQEMVSHRVPTCPVAMDSKAITACD